MTNLPPAPAELAWLTSLIGDEAALRLIEARGGTRLYFPRTGGGSKLADEIGEVAASALGEAYGGEYRKIPLAKEWRVRLYRAQGMSWAKIALTLKVSEDTVGRLLNAAGLTHSQLDLFK